MVTTSSFALGVAIVSTYRSFTRNIEAALFGNILGITPRDLWIIASISIVVFVALIVMRRQLLFLTFDPEVASAYGIATGRTDLFFVILLAITVLASTQILGVTLVAAAMVIPPVIGRYLTQTLSDPAVRLAADRDILQRRRHVSEFLLGHFIGRDHRAHRRRVVYYLGIDHAAAQRTFEDLLDRLVSEERFMWRVTRSELKE